MWASMFMSCELNRYAPSAVCSIGKYWPGAFLFDNRILPAARLRAFAVVAVAAGQIVGEQAASGEGHAHRAMHEAFDVEVVGNAGADVAHGLQVHFVGPATTRRAPSS